MAETLQDQVALEEIAPNHYISKVLPKRIGNALPVGYGGFTVGVAVHAAYKSVREGYSLYSLVGHFLGPSSTEAQLHVKTHTVRDTRTFATRRVQVSQIKEDGSERLCLEALIDFQAQEEPWFSYSTPPRTSYSSPKDSQTLIELLHAAASNGQISKEKADQVKQSFQSSADFVETKLCPEGVSGQNIMGALGDCKTAQNDLAIVEKTSGDWVRMYQAIPTPGERMAAAAFILDGGLAFVPLTHSNMWLGDAAACSTLDFALRVFVPDIDLSSWHLRERQTIAAGSGRTYTEGRLWREDGTMVASITQQSILRAKQPSKKNKL